MIGVRAALEAFTGAFDRAEGLYNRAIGVAVDAEQRSFFVRRLSLLILNRASKDYVRSFATISECWFGTQSVRGSKYLCGSACGVGEFFGVAA